MKISNTEVFNFEGAFRGLRNPLDSWNKSDSKFGIEYLDQYFDTICDVAATYVPDIDYDDENDTKMLERKRDWLYNQQPYLSNDDDCRVVTILGKKDLDLAQKMLNGGPEESKFMRQIFVSVDFTLPLYIWKEFDTYKIGTTANSCSTMHTISKKPITRENFEFDSYGDTGIEIAVSRTIEACEELRKKYLETKDKRYWRALIQLLPEAWLQKRTITLNYQVLRNIYFQRRYHKLKEWHEICTWIESLPYAKELICYEGKNK